MPNIPRDLSGMDLAKLLNRFGYVITRQTGSHIRLTTTFKGLEHHVTIPNHNPLKIGTLNNIINDIASYLGMDKQGLIKEFFGKR
jgi:predicted RNA binding protein YcfA (HicA-like mRNA interferase family)